jgi:ketosteroid isomerase-like protein
MSQENVEVVRRMYEAFHGGDIEAALGQLAADVLVDASNARPDVPVGKGPEHMRSVVATWVSAFDDWSEEIEEFRDLGSRVLVLSVQRGRGRGSGVEVESRYAMLYEVHGGRITSVRMFRGLGEALRHTGAGEASE